ncbi:Uncharacterised protein [Mycobacteroides abscessus subsp. abscessus]|nr:Uncharacterised protein [Mycobacteroides abscessus subsp. abscessus]
MGAEHVPEVFVAAFADQVQVEFAEGGQEAVAVGGDHRRTAGVLGDDPVVHQLGVREHRGEDAVTDRVEWMVDAAHAHAHLGRVRAQHPHDGAVGVRMRAEHRVRIAVRARGEQHEIAAFDQRAGNVAAGCGHLAVAAVGRILGAAHRRLRRCASGVRRAAGTGGSAMMCATARAGSKRTQLVCPQWYSSPLTSSKTTGWSCHSRPIAGRSTEMKPSSGPNGLRLTMVRTASPLTGSNFE